MSKDGGAAFKIGDRVTWTSQSHGNATTKRGTVTAIVPPESSPYNNVPRGYKPRYVFGFCSKRDHESYLVRVGDRSRRLYWPVVSLLIAEDAAHVKEDSK